MPANTTMVVEPMCAPRAMGSAEVAGKAFDAARAIPNAMMAELLCSTPEPIKAINPIAGAFAAQSVTRRLNSGSAKSVFVPHPRTCIPRKISARQRIRPNPELIHLFLTLQRK